MYESAKHHFGHPTGNWHKHWRQGSKPMQTATRSSFKVWGELWKPPLFASQLQHVAGPEAWLHVYDLNGTKASVMKSSFLSHSGICHRNPNIQLQEMPNSCGSLGHSDINSRGRIINCSRWASACFMLDWKSTAWSPLAKSMAC